MSDSALPCLHLTQLEVIRDLASVERNLRLYDTLVTERVQKVLWFGECRPDHDEIIIKASLHLRHSIRKLNLETPGGFPTDGSIGLVVVNKEDASEPAASLEFIRAAGLPVLILDSNEPEANPVRHRVAENLWSGYKFQLLSKELRHWEKKAIEAEELVQEKQNKIEDLTPANEEMELEIHRLTHELMSERGRLRNMRNSLSWILTMPFRSLYRTVQRTVRPMPHKEKNPVQDFKVTLTEMSPAQQRSYQNWTTIYEGGKTNAKGNWRKFNQWLTYRPLISVVMPVYNPDLQWLREAIESVRTQVYPEWELCMADDNSKDPGVRQLLTEYAAKDERIRVEFRKTNGHISAASNSALSLATGDYVAFLDHDDLLAPDALLRVAYEIGHHRDVGLIYSDEDKIEPDGKRNGPYFKPDWSPELLESQNYLCHLTVIRTDLVREVGGFRLGFEGSQDYDLVLRCTEKLRPEQIRHIPHILYHWRIHKNSTAMNVDLKPYAWDAGRRAIAEHFDRIGMGVTVTVSPENSLFYRIKPTERNESDLVTIIIPTRNHRTSLETCLNSLLQKTEYHNFEILIVDNGSDEPETLAYLRSITADSRVRVIRDDGPFNFSRLNNRAVRYANGEFVLLLNNDVEVINPDWLDEMLFYARRPGVGVVGARLWYRDERLQHAGVILGVGGVAGHAFYRYPRGKGGYAGLAALVQNRSAVTGACLLTRRSIYQAVGGLDEAGLSVAFNDVDYCLKVLKSGRRIVWTPFAELYHDESLSRGFEDTPEKILRFQRECILMKKRWGPLLQNDPYFNPNLALEQECEAMAFPARSKRYPDFE